MRFRVLSYNIHRAIGLDRRFRPDRIIRIIEHHDPDIVLLQEVDEGVPRSRELDLARELAEALGFPHYAVGHNVTLRKGRYGNATMTRFPILRERNIDLTIGSRKRRGCQHTTIEMRESGSRSRHLEVFNLHLGLSARERERQVGLLVRSREFADLDRGVSCMVGGDFNDWRSRLQPIFHQGLCFDLVTEHANGRPIATHPSFSPRGGLDRIYIRGGLRSHGARRCRMQLSRVASDHLPIIADLELR
jgi:endonuclease/exonuclease/phosphatase family metal-dependent hydrolase